MISNTIFTECFSNLAPESGLRTTCNFPDLQSCRNWYSSPKMPLRYFNWFSDGRDFIIYKKWSCTIFHENDHCGKIKGGGARGDPWLHSFFYRSSWDIREMPGMLFLDSRVNKFDLKFLAFVKFLLWEWNCEPAKVCVSSSSSQCYKAFTGLFLQVCKYRAIFNVICGLKYCLIPYVNACFHF